MAGNASISGLASGLDTATIISQLMALEAIPQDRLRTRVTTQERQVGSLNTLNARLAALSTKASELAEGSSWAPLKVTTGSDHVTVTTTATAAPSSFGFTIDQTATSHQLGFAGVVGLDDVVTPGSTLVRLNRPDGSTVDLETGDGTLRGLVAAINDPANATGLRANAVKVGDGQFRLLVESTATGAASAFFLTDADGNALLGDATVRAGRDAQITLGAGITAISSSNTFTDLLDGITVSIGAATPPGSTAEVTVARDTETMSSKIKALVDQANSVISEMDSLTAYGVGGATAGILAGDSTVRSLRSELVNSLYSGGTGSLASVGVQVDRYGKFVFDKATFDEAYAADPSTVTTKFVNGDSPGFAAALHTLAEDASDARDGTLTLAITGRKSQIKDLNASIDGWDLRLELRQTALTRQFTALEVALSQMNSQSSWLAGQINSLSAGAGS